MSFVPCLHYVLRQTNQMLTYLHHALIEIQQLRSAHGLSTTQCNIMMLAGDNSTLTIECHDVMLLFPSQSSLKDRSGIEPE